MEFRTLKKKRRLINPKIVFESATYNKPFSVVYETLMNYGRNSLKNEHSKVYEHRKIHYTGLMPAFMLLLNRKRDCFTMHFQKPIATI